MTLALPDVGTALVLGLLVLFGLPVVLDLVDFALVLLTTRRRDRRP